MHESRARRLVDAETRAATAEAIRKDLEERLVDAEARASLAEDRARDVDVPGILPDRLYTVGTEIPNGENGVMAVIDISYGTISRPAQHGQRPVAQDGAGPGQDLL